MCKTKVMRGSGTNNLNHGCIHKSSGRMNANSTMMSFMSNVELTKGMSSSFPYLTIALMVHTMVNMVQVIVIVLNTCTNNPISSVSKDTGACEATIGINTVSILTTVACANQAFIYICCHDKDLMQLLNCTLISLLLYQCITCHHQCNQHYMCIENFPGYLCKMHLQGSCLFYYCIHSHLCES